MGELVERFEHHAARTATQIAAQFVATTHHITDLQPQHSPPLRLAQRSLAVPS
jgi:hypothetical protein